MANKKEQELKKIKNPEERLEYLYREIFYMTDKVNQVLEQQRELGKLFINLLKEYDKIKSFHQKFFKT